VTPLTSSFKATADTAVAKHGFVFLAGRPGVEGPTVLPRSQPMTASECTPEQGHESGGSTENEFSPFEQFARREIATQLRMQPTRVEEAARSMAEDVDEGRPVDAEDAAEVRKQARELLRLVDGVTLASGSDADADREELAKRLLGALNDVDEGVKHLDSKVLNEDGIQYRDLEMVLGYVDQLEQVVVEIAEKVPREDD